MKFGYHTIDADVFTPSANGCSIVALTLDFAFAAIQARRLFGVHPVKLVKDISLVGSILLIPSGAEDEKDILHHMRIQEGCANN